MSNTQTTKERERHCVQVLKEVIENFPPGQVIADEKQERPDVLVIGLQGTTGIEVTRILNEPLKRTESECEAMVSAACQLYEKRNLPHLQVSVHPGAETAFNKSNRSAFALALANLVAANIPDPKSSAGVDNDWNNPQVFPYEIHSIGILRNNALSRNYWTVGSAGWIQENFTEQLQAVLASKESLLRDYDAGCAAHWLLVVAENSSAASFFDPSESTLSHQYVSSFDRAFLLDLFKRRAFELQLKKPPH